MKISAFDAPNGAIAITKDLVLRAAGMALFIMAIGAPTSASAGDFFNGFETDTACWFTPPNPLRVPSGTNGITSAIGSFHAEAAVGAFTRWGGYDDSDSCASTAGDSFPAAGYDTAIDIYLDVNAGYANDTRFDFSSAINGPDGTHRRDFIISCGFYDDADLTGPGAGTDRFICTASNNSPGWPKNPDREPTMVANTSGWYTVLHQFRDNGAGELTVDISMLNAGGTVIHTWTLSDPSDVIDSTVGGNRYGWFVTNGFGTLAIDNSRRTSIVPNGPSLSCVGFEAPLNNSVVVKKKSNRVLPLRMALLDGDGLAQTNANLTASPVVQVTYNGVYAGTADLLSLDSAGKGDEGNVFVFNGSNWSFNMQAKGLASGTYEITAVSGDAAEYVIDPTCHVSLTVE